MALPTWGYALICLGVFFVAYLLNTSMITVGYHRGLAHGAVTLSPRAKWFVQHFGIWFTGLDPKGWVCMHRLHHDHSDTKKDPHSPVTFGILGVFLAQLRSYENILIKLAVNEPRTSAVVDDIDFDISPLNRMKMWWLPYAVHAVIALAIALPTGMWLLGVCYWMGMMTHPIEGGIVNSIGHAIGGRNFDTDDNSRNNHFAAWFIMGEGYQNNHHAHPASARFSYKANEVDVGYKVVQFLELVGALKINREMLIENAVAREVPGVPPREELARAA